MTTTIRELQNRQELLSKDMEEYIREVVLNQPDQQVQLKLGPDEDPEDAESYPVVTTFRDERDMTIGISSVFWDGDEICIAGYDIDNDEEKEYCEIYPAVYPDILEFLSKILSLE